MFFGVFGRQQQAMPACRKGLILLVVAFVGALSLPRLSAQTQTPDASQQPPVNPNKQDAPPEAGGWGATIVSLHRSSLELGAS